jgi:hypothetical protein
MRAKRFRTESELAEKVILFLRDQGWEVYQEVKVKNEGGVADLVAIRGAISWIIECKLTYGLPVIYQARGWIGKAHYVSVAVPPSANYSGILDEYCRWKGIGRIRVGDYPGVDLQAKLWRRPSKAVMDGLCEEMKTYSSAGNNYSSYFSPYKRTCGYILGVVKKNPGICLKDLVASIDHHYSSIACAKQSISYWAHKGKIPGIACVREGRRVCFYESNQ